MIRKLMLNDLKQNKFLSVVTCFFMAVSAMLFGLTVLLFGNLLGSIDALMEQAGTPDFLQMHSGEINEADLISFAEENKDISKWQVCTLLNLENGILTLDGHSLADSTQDNGLCVQSEKFDYLLTMDNEIPEVCKGEVYVPVCYMQEFSLQEGELMKIGSESFIIAGFIRDSQMNSMMASSKRFLVNAEDYERLNAIGTEEYLIEFSLKEGCNINEFSTAYAEAKLPANGPTVTYSLIRMMNALSDGLMILVILLVSVVVLLISMLCIRFVLLTRLEKDRKEIGMLKMIGIPRQEIRQLYYIKFIFLSVTGAVIGLLFAYILQHPLAEQMKELYGTTAEEAVVFLFSLVGVAIVEGILLLSICHTLKQTEQLSAVEALFGRTRTEKKRLVSKQYILISLVVAAGVFLMLIPQNLSSTISSPKFVTYMGIGDGEIRLDIRQTENIAEKMRQMDKELSEDNRVSNHVTLQTKSYRVILPSGEASNLTIEQGNHMIFPVTYEEGQAPVHENDIALSFLNAKELSVAPGDTISLIIDNKRKEYRVCGIYSDITNGGKTAKTCVIKDEHPVMWSIFYVTLADEIDEEKWISDYQERFAGNQDVGVKVVDIADYELRTYGQTIQQIRLAANVAMVIAVAVIIIVTSLFLRLLVEKERYQISLQKALGFTNAEVRGIYFKKSLVCSLIAIAVGILLGTIPGEVMAGLILRSFGAAGFRFVLDFVMVFVKIPVVTLVTVLVSVRLGIREVRNVKAYECCVGKE